MRLRLLLSISLILGLAATTVFAQPVTTELTGVVAESNGIYGDITVGSAVDAYFTVDSTQASSSFFGNDTASLQTQSARGGLISSEVFVNGVNLAIDPSTLGAFTVYQSISSDASNGFFGNSSEYSLSQQYNWGGGGNYQADYFVNASGPSAYSSDGSVPQFSPGQQANGVLNDSGSFIEYTVTGTKTVAGPPGASRGGATVPAPLSSGLLALGLLGAALRRRTAKAAMLT